MADVTQSLSGVADLAVKLQSGSVGSAMPALDLGSLLGNMSMTTIAVSLLAGLVGSGYFMYGRKSCNIKMLYSGIALCVVPYFIGNATLLIVACVAMAVVPFVL